MWKFFRKLFGGSKKPTPRRAGPTRDLEELSKRLGVSLRELENWRPQYRAFQIAKRSGGTRQILAPEPRLKAIQRRILRKVLGGLKSHPAATGFERGHSIVTNALPHVGRDVVIRMDLKDFFGSVKAERVKDFFLAIGWDDAAAGLLTKLVTHEGSLPQGAPTSPRLSNLVNAKLDRRLDALAESRGLAYSRYADDITFSGPAVGEQGRSSDVVHAAKAIIADEGYRAHVHKKLRIARRHDRQVVTGLVVNEKVNLPRRVRRRLRAIEHYVRIGRKPTLSDQQIAGWRALVSMIEMQRGESE